ncbi:MAG: phosphotransferase [Pseudomonadota bacterium]
MTAYGWQTARLAPLAGDASARRYDRLCNPTLGNAVLMDAPVARGEDTQPFLAIGQWLRAAGLSAPEIYADDRQTGFVLMEDLGDALFARHCIQFPREEPVLYAAAVDLLVALHGLAPPEAIATAQGRYRVGRYDMEALQAEAALLTGWYLPAARSDRVDPSGFRAALAAALQEVAQSWEVLVLRDYHAENLLWLPQRAAKARVGLLDFQDALRGHRAYDLVSLLQDARRDIDPALPATLVARYLAATGLPAPAFHRAFATLGAQRNLKIIGIFSRLCRRDGKSAYLKLIPRVWAHLLEDLRHPALFALAAWVDRHVPPPTTQVLQRIEMAR